MISKATMRERRPISLLKRLEGILPERPRHRMLLKCSGERCSRAASDPARVELCEHSLFGQSWVARQAGSLTPLNGMMLGLVMVALVRVVLCLTLFTPYWKGFAVVPIPVRTRSIIMTKSTAKPIILTNNSYSVVGEPTISVAMINAVLAAYHSPAADQGQSLYALGVQYHIDPVFALAFFLHESSFGTEGEARSSLSLGNLRCIPNAQCIDDYAWFPSWEAGFQAWYALISDLYVKQWGLMNIDQIIPRYAPPADDNNDTAYISSLKLSIDTWHAGQVIVQ